MNDEGRANMFGWRRSRRVQDQQVRSEEALAGLDVSNLSTLDDVIPTVAAACGKHISVQPIDDDVRRTLTAYSLESDHEITIFLRPDAPSGRVYQTQCLLNQLGYIMLRKRAWEQAGEPAGSELAPIPTRDLDRYNSPDATVDDKAAEDFAFAIVHHVFEQQRRKTPWL